MITTRLDGSPRPPSAWPSAPTRWSITATHAWHWQRFWSAAGDVAGARAAAERAVGLYERKGAAALAEKARRILGERERPAAPAPPEAPGVELDNACVRAGERVVAAIDREAWDEVEQLFAPDARRRESPEDRRLYADRRPIGRLAHK